MYGDGHGSIIIDDEILRDRYIPEKIKAREDQIEQIQCCLSPVINRQKPIHLWLYGKPGTGKTTTAVHAIRWLEEKSNINSIIINCWEKRSFYEILDEIISQLRILRAEQHRTSLKLEKIRLFLKGHPFVVMLDEIDQIRPRELSTVLYNLDSILNAGLICISGSVQRLAEIEDRVRSRLNPHTISFPAYSQRELFNILTHRVESALSENGCSQTALKQIARVSQGDARAAIRMLHRAAVMADHQKIDRITTARLKEQFKAAGETRKNSILSNLTHDHRMLFEIVKQNRQVLSGNLWQKYLQNCEQARRKPLAPRTFSDYANRLVQSGLITSERARVKGKVRLFKVIV